MFGICQGSYVRRRRSSDRFVDRPIRLVHEIPGIGHAEAAVGGLGAGVVAFDVEAQAAGTGVTGEALDVAVEGGEDAAGAEVGVDVDALDPPEVGVAPVGPFEGDHELSYHTIANIGEEGALFKIPKTLPLRDIDRGAVTHVSYPPELARGAGSYHHIGDIDFVDSWNLIVGAVESNSGAPPVVALFDRDLAFRGKARLDHQHEAPWCAVEPRTKLLVSSVFNYSDAGPIELQFYALDRPSPATVEATWVGNMVLRDRDGAELKAKGVQGAAFSKRGHLYLAVQEQINRSDGALWPAGIRAFDMLTGRLVLWHNIDFKPGPEELEGLTLWDADKEYVGIVGGVEVDTGNRPHVPHGVHGQIHVIMSRNGTSLYFKHYGIIKGSADDL